MAKTFKCTKTTMVVNFLFVISLLFILSEAENRIFGRFGIVDPIGSIRCDSVYGVKDGDTCFGVSQTFDLTTTYFESINPNVNCTNLFVGQWICVLGTTT